MLDGRFEILSTLGNGAMSVVVAARHLQLRQKVAIKMLRPEYAGYPDVVTRFLREARAAACLRNEHVVSVTDVGMLPTGVPYLIMEYLEGTDLAAHLAAHGPLMVDLAVEYVFQVLEALAEAHRAGIIHRDIKPANLLLAQREDGSALIKVLDFGVSKFTGPEYTAHGLTVQAPLLGSPAYMSPEQIKDPSSVDVRTDIWSVGVVLYELVTGQLPFSGRTAPELVAAICSPHPTPISSLISRIPIELVGVIGKCVNKRADGRYASVQELARALLPFVRTAASQVSVDRILGIASAPRPVASELVERRSEAPRSGVATVREHMTLAGHGPRPWKRTALSALGVVTVCAAGFGAAALLRNGGGASSVTPASRAAASDPVCAAPEAAAQKEACAPSEPEQASVSLPPARAVAAPAVAGLTSGQDGTSRRTSRSNPRNEASSSSVNAAETPASESAERPAPRVIFSYPGARPLDAENPYAPK